MSVSRNKYGIVSIVKPLRIMVVNPSVGLPIIEGLSKVYNREGLKARNGGPFLMRGTFVLAALSLVGCSHMSIVCPDGETVTVLRNIQDAYPVYAKDYEAQFRAASNQLDKVASNVNVSAELKSNTVKLRQDLDQERAALQERLKTMVISLQTTPCDKEVRKRVLDLQEEVKNRANQIPDRIKGAGIVNIQEMKDSPGAFQVGSADSITIYQYSDRTDDQAAAQLQSETKKLLRFPDAIQDSSKPASLIEKMLVNKLPRRLFDLLMTYNEQVVMHVPQVGNALHLHMTNYYQFRQKALKLEDRVTTRIGQLVRVRFTEAWKIYLRYVIMRFDGQSKESIIAAGNFLNYDITWDDAERVFAQLSNEPPIPNDFSELFALHNSLIEDVRKITSAI